MLEKNIEAKVVRYAKELGCLTRKMNGEGYRGWPDRLFVLPRGGRSFWIEFKRKGQELSPWQEELVSQLMERGQVVYVVDDAGKGKAVIDSEIFAMRVCDGR